MPGPLVGLAAEYRVWDHRAQGGELAAELTALVQTDPGDDVVWVVGVTAGVGGDSTSFERLGSADSGHVLVRGYAEGEQRKALERAFPEASADERGDALVARRRHQTTVVLLHQLAHSLGALHENEPDGIMSASLAARCALEFRRDAIASARRLCERALAQGRSSWALYLLGTMELETRRGPTAAGMVRLREAIALDPDLVQAWRKLARVLEKARATAELEQLRRDYRARFGAALPD